MRQLLLALAGSALLCGSAFASAAGSATTSPGDGEYVRHRLWRRHGMDNQHREVTGGIGGSIGIGHKPGDGRHHYVDLGGIHHAMKSLRLVLAAAALGALLVNSAQAGSTGASTGAGSFVAGSAASYGNATSVQTGINVGTAVGVATSSPRSSSTRTSAVDTTITSSKTHVGNGGAAGGGVVAGGFAAANAWTTP